MIGLLFAVFLGTVGVVQGHDIEAGKIMQKLQEQVLAPVATSCVEMKIFDNKDLKRKLVFRRGYFYGPVGEKGMGEIKEKIFLDFVFPPELSRMKYFLVEDKIGFREKELLWTSTQRKVRRIFNADRAWVQASDYYFYDLLDHINEKGWEYFLTDKKGNIFTIEAKFTGKPKVYGRLTIKVEKIEPDVFVYNEITFYDKQGNLSKKEKYFDFKHVWDIYYRPSWMIMESLDPSRNTKTELKFRHWQVRPIKEEDSLVFQDLYLKLEKDFPSQCSEKDF